MRLYNYIKEHYKEAPCLDCSYEEAREKFAEYISVCGITRRDVDLYITKYPISVLKAFYKLKLDKILA